MLSQRSLFNRTLLFFVLIVPFTLFAQTPPKEGSATIAGTVTLNGEPMRNVVVTIQPLDSFGSILPNSPRAKTDANGRFRITGIAAGQYVIGALAAAFVPQSEQSGRSGSEVQGKTVNVANGETIENLELTLRRGSVITGRVTDANGEPLTDTHVQLRRVNEHGRSTSRQPTLTPMIYQTDDRGAYRIFGLLAGKYKVSVGSPLQPGYSSYYGSRSSRGYLLETFHPDTTDEAQAKVIELEDGQEASGVDIKAAEAVKTFEISGRVVDAATNQPVAGIPLSLSTISPSGQARKQMMGDWRTDVDGEFQIIGALPGKHSILIEDGEGKSNLYSDPTAVEIVNDDIEGIVIRAKQGISISGTVVIEGTNDPALLARRSQLRVSANPMLNGASGSSRSVRVNPDGSFRIFGQIPGKLRLYGYSHQVPKVFMLRAERGGASLKNWEIEIRPGEQINDLRIVFAYGDGTLRGELKIIGAELPEGFQFSISLVRVDGAPLPLSYAALDERGRFIFKDLMPGQYEVRLRHSFSGKATPEIVSKLFPRLADVKQLVTVSNGSETQANLTVDLSQEK